VPSEIYPERSLKEVEDLADAFAATYFSSLGQDYINTPIPVEDIAEHYLGYAIDITDEGLFSDPNFLGGIDFEENKIFVNASVEDHDGRYAFTVAHEIGHHVLHKDAYMNEQTHGEKKVLCRDTSEKQQIEIEADRFAAALLMPSQIIIDAFKELGQKKKVSTIGQARGLANSLVKGAGLNNVSNTAMINRLIDLKIISSSMGYQSGQFKKSYRKPTIIQIIRGSIFRLFRRF